MNVAKKRKKNREKKLIFFCMRICLPAALPDFWKTTNRQKPHFSRYISTTTNTVGAENYQRHRIPAKGGHFPREREGGFWES